MKRLLSWFTATPLVLLSTAALLLCCCTTTWLPDSSGFVSISQQGRVVLFDLASGKETEIVAGSATPGFGSVAVAPDSRRLAVAQMIAKEDRKDLLLSIYSVTGELLHRSEEIGFPATKEAYQGMAVSSYWSPDGKRILLCPFGTAATAIGYDVATQQTQKFPDSLPLGLIGFESLPIRAAVPFLPDSSGFLALTDSNAAGSPAALAEIRLCQFAPATPARSEPFTLTPAARKRFAPVAADAVPDDRVLLPARWSEGKLLLTRDRGYLVVDPQTKQVDYREDEKIEKLARYAEQHDVRVVDLLGDDLVVQMTSPGLPVEIAERETGTVRSKVEFSGQQSYPITVAVAPNRQFLLVTCSMPHLQYWVFDVAGKQIHHGRTGQAIGRP